MAFTLEEEIIDGHLVTSDVKKLWAVEMDLAQKLLDVCKKHNLEIWATGGTLIGAVRHHGFIPWDDDMDFCMLREDYNKLVKIGPSEFKYPYFFQYFSTDNFWGGMAKIRRSDTTMIEESYKVHSDFNRGIFVDILVLDAVPDELSQARYCYMIMRLFRRMLYNYKIVNSTSFNKFYQIRHSIVRSIVKALGPNRMNSWVERLSSKYSNKQYKNVALLGFYANEQYDFSKFKIRKKSYYDETVMLPFHDMEVPAPKEYHKLLTDLFGDYMTPKQIKAEHTNTIIDTEHSYVEIMQQLRNKDNN